MLVIHTRIISIDNILIMGRPTHLVIFMRCVSEYFGGILSPLNDTCLSTGAIFKLFDRSADSF